MTANVPAIILGINILRTGQASAHGPAFNDIVRAGPGAGLKLAGPGRAPAGK